MTPSPLPRSPRRGLLPAMVLVVALVCSPLWHGCALSPSLGRSRGAVAAANGQVHLAWDAQTTRADGTFLSDIAGFKLYYGPASGTYAFMKTLDYQTTYDLSGLEPGQTYYMALTAFDSTGTESRLSDELTVTVPPATARTILLTLEPIRRGQPSQFRVRGALPDEIVSFLFSRIGEGEGPCSLRLGGLCVDLIEPWVFGEAAADVSGTATLDRLIPADTRPGQIIAVQAVIQRGQNGADSVKTNAVTAIVVN